MKAMPLLPIALGLAAAACGDGAVEVAHPFYLMAIDPREPAMFRCPRGPGNGCAIDGLPGPVVEAAGADARFVVVAQRPSAGGPTQHYYFARVAEETSGWGANPEQIVGPLDAQAFAAAKARFGLPDLTVRR